VIRDHSIAGRFHVSPIQPLTRQGVIHQVFNGSLSLAAPRKAETLVLAFLRHEAKSSDTR
jgi:hypothetical protein